MVTKYFDVPFANSGDKTTIPDASQPSGDVSFQEGWTPDYAKDQTTDPNAKDVPRQSENYFKFVVTEAIKELQEYGSKPYSNLVNYPVGAHVPGSDNFWYVATAANGPDTSVVDPVGDVSGTWRLTGESPDLKVITSSGSYNKPDGLKFIEVIVIGAGGGGGGASAGNNNAVGGSGGGTSIKRILASALSASETLTIGSGGNGGDVSGTDGSPGGTSSFGTHCSATGGNGGPGATSTIQKGSLPAGIGSGGDIDFSGSAARGVGVDSSISGGGGGSFYGGMSRDLNGGTVNAADYGSGGSGADSTAGVGQTGGNGSDGIIVIKEFF